MDKNYTEIDLEDLITEINSIVLWQIMKSKAADFDADWNPFKDIDDALHVVMAMSEYSPCIKYLHLYQLWEVSFGDVTHYTDEYLAAAICIAAIKAACPTANLLKFEPLFQALLS